MNPHCLENNTGVNHRAAMSVMTLGPCFTDDISRVMDLNNNDNYKEDACLPAVLAISTGRCTALQHSTP